MLETLGRNGLTWPKSINELEYSLSVDFPDQNYDNIRLKLFSVVIYLQCLIVRVDFYT